MTGDDYDLIIHCTFGVDGALPDFQVERGRGRGSWVGKGYEDFCPPQLPKAKKDATTERGAEGAMTGDDLMLHCTIGHLHRVDGALPDFEDGEKAMNLLAPPGVPRYIFCIFIILCIFCIFIVVRCADTFCARRSQSMDFGTIS